MQDLNGLPIGPDQLTFDEMLQKEAARVFEEMDSFAATRHNERTEVTAGYVRRVVKIHRTRSGKSRVNKPIMLSDVIDLDPGEVAQVVAKRFGPEGRARVEEMVKDLINHARHYLADRQAVVEEISQSLAKELAGFIERSLARHISHPFRSRITLDVAIDPACSNSVR